MFCDLIWEVTSRRFCCLLWVTQTNPRAVSVWGVCSSLCVQEEITGGPPEVGCHPRGGLPEYWAQWCLVYGNATGVMQDTSPEPRVT